MTDTNPPVALTPRQVANLRPIAEYPHHEPWRHFWLAWHTGAMWEGMFGCWQDDAGFEADPVIHCTRTLAREPTHYVNDIR